VKYSEAVSVAVSYIAEDALETVYDVGHFIEHGLNLAMLIGLTWGNFLLMPITALVWAREIQQDPAKAAERQFEKNHVDD
jgi:hypothetical protein